MCPNCRYTGMHHPACPQRHIVGGPHHHHGHHGGGFGGPWGGWDYPYPVYLQCPVGWTTDINGNCIPPAHKVGQDMQPYDPASYQENTQGAGTVNPNTGGVQRGPSGSTNVSPYPSIPGADSLAQAGTGLGKGISDAAMYLALAGLAIVGVVAYTAYKTDAPRHAADAYRSGLSRADESSKMAAKLLV